MSLKADVTVEAEDGPQRFVVTYDGPPMALARNASKIDPANLRVETDLGDTVVASGSVALWVWFSPELHKDFTLNLHLQNQGATQ